MSSSNLVEDYSEEEKQGGMEFYWTGHPFVDAGLTAILLITGKDKPEELSKKDIEKAIDFASELYVRNEWIKPLSRIFRNNNPILMINPSMRKDASPERLKESLKTLLEAIPSEKEPGAKCVTCGRGRKISGLELRKAIHTKDKNKPKEITGDIFPLLGTGDLRNFFFSGNFLGADVCVYCLFLIQFMPISVYHIGRRVLLIHTYPYEKMIEFHREAIQDVLRSKLASNARDFGRPENFFFKKVGEIARRVDCFVEQTKHRIIHNKN